MNTLQTLASGDTNYISKHNSNYATIAAAIAGLETGIAGAGNSETNWSEWLSGMYGAGPTLIGADSYETTGSGTSVSVAAGTVWLGDIQKVVSSSSSVSLTLSGAAGTYYVVPNGAGVPTISSSSTNAVYSVVWTGSGVSTITRIAEVSQDASDTATVYTAATASDFHGWKNGTPGSGEVLVRYVMPRATTFPVDFAGSRLKSVVSATSTATFSIKKNGTEVGTAAVSAASTVASFTMASAAAFAAGDLLTVVAPASADATLADIAFTLVGTQTF